MPLTLHDPLIGVGGFWREEFVGTDNSPIDPASWQNSGSLLGFGDIVYDGSGGAKLGSSTLGVAYRATGQNPTIKFSYTHSSVQGSIGHGRVSLFESNMVANGPRMWLQLHSAAGSASNAFTLHKNDGSTNSQLATADSDGVLSRGGTYEFRIVVSGSNIEVFVGEVSALTYTLTAAERAMYLRPNFNIVGIQFHDSDTSGRFNWIEAIFTPISPTWKGQLHALWGDGNPNSQDVLWNFQNTIASVAGPTPTQIGTTVGRLVQFRYETPITVASIRFNCITQLTASIYMIAIYEADSTNRVFWSALSTSSGGWFSTTPASPFTLAADTPYWFGISATATSTTAFLRSPAAPLTSSITQTMPGSIQTHGARFAQVALTGGSWPTTLPTLAAPAFVGGSTGTIPIFFADSI